MKHVSLSIRITLELLDAIKKAKAEFEIKHGLKISLSVFARKLMEHGLQVIKSHSQESQGGSSKPSDG